MYMAETYSVEAVLKAKVTDFVSGFKQATSVATDFVDRNKATFDSFKQVGAAATAGGLAVSAGLGFAVKKAEEFESGMSSVAAVSGVTGKDFEMLSNKAREMGSATSFSATDAAKGLEYMALAGWNTQQMMGGLEPILHLAEAGAMDLGRTSDLVTDSMAALGLTVDDLGPYLDKVAQTSRKANTDIDALMEAMVIAGGTFSRFNVPLEEANAFLGVLANRGTKGSEAGTALNAIMDRLTSGTGQAADALEELGLSAFDADGNFIGMEATMLKVKDALEGMTDEEKAHYQSMIAGLNHGKSFEKMLQGLGDEYFDLKGEIIESEGALKDMRNTMKDNLQGDLENLSSAFEEMAISIGSVLLPYVKEFIAFVQSLADKFNSLDDNTKTIIAVIATLSAGFLLLVGPILMLVGFIPSMLAGFTALSTVFAAIASPITLVVLAIIAIGAALVVAYNKFEWFRDVVDAVWQAIVGAIMAAVDGIVAFVQDIATQITTYWNENGELIRAATENVWNFIKGIIETVMPIIEKVISFAWQAIQVVVMAVWENIKGVIQGALDIILGLVKVFAGLFTGDWQAMWDGVKQLFSGAVNFLWNLVQLMLWGKLLKGIAAFAGTFRTAVSTMWTSVRSLFTNAINAIRNFFTNGFNAMKNVANTSMNTIRTTISNVWNAIRNTFTTVVNGIKNIVTNGFNAIKTTISNIMTKSVQVVKDSVTKFFSAGKDLVQGLINGIKEMTSAAIGAITGVVDGVVNKAKSLLGIKSPSRVFMAIGDDTGQGWAIGIAKTAEVNKKAVEGVAKVITNAANSANTEINKLQKKQAADEKAIIDKKNRDIANIRAAAANKKRKLTLQEAQRIQKIEIDASTKILNIRKKSGTDIAKVEQGLSKKRLDAIKLYIDDKKSLDELSLNDEAAIWKKAISTFKAGTKERVEAQKNYNKASQEAEKQRISDAEDFVRRQKELGKMSLSDEIIYWNEMRKNTKSGSEENLAARKNHQAAVKELRSQVEAANKEFNDRLLAIDKEYADESKKLQDEVNKAYEDHMNKLLNFAGIFDEFKRSNDITGQDLIKNLESQVDALQEYGDVMSDLSGRIDDKSLVDELKGLGVKSLDQLQALNSLSDEELSRYVELYQIKFKEAKEQTDSEMQPMIDEVDQKLVDLKKDTSKRLDEVNKEWQLKINQIVKGVDKEFDSMHQVGIDAMQGLSSGMASMRSALVGQAQSIANSVKNAMAGAFDIHSPSRWMRDFIGKNMMFGWIDGIEAMRSKVVNMATNATEWMKPDVPVLAGINVPSFPQANYQSKPVGSSNAESSSNSSGVVINQENHFHGKVDSPSENARKIKQQSRDLLKEWRR